MNEKINVQPAKGLKVQRNFKETSGKVIHIKAEGDKVPNTRYYRNLIRRGELIEVKPDKVTKPTRKKAGSK